MSLRKTFSTSERVLRQLKHDHRTLAMVLVVPALLLTVLKYVFYERPEVFERAAPIMLGIFPLVMMFLITSITTLRERKSGTLDRLMTQPIHKLDFIFGYAVAFSLIGFLQACVVSFVTLGILGVAVEGGTLALLVAATLAAFLGTTLGLFVSAFARNEFQAVQLVMPIIMPQVLLSGLFIAREQMARPLELLSGVLPLTYSVEAMRAISMHTRWSSALTVNMMVTIGFGIVALLLGAITIRRQE